MTVIKQMMKHQSLNHSLKYARSCQHGRIKNQVVLYTCVVKDKGLRIKTIFYNVRRTVFEFPNGKRNLNFIADDSLAQEMYDEIATFFLYSEYDSSLEVVEMDTDPSKNPNFMFHGKTRINVHGNFSIDANLMFIEETVFEKFCSSPQKWIKCTSIKDSKILQIRSRRRIKRIVEEIGKTFEKNLSMPPLSLTYREDKSAFETLLVRITGGLKSKKSKTEKFILFCFTVLCLRQIVGADVPLVLEGECFELLDRKARYRLCETFSKYVEQTIICTTKSVVNTPIDYDYGKLLSRMPRCNVYEILG